MAKRRQKDDEWKEAKKRCRLNMEELQMAKELGMSPRGLTKNIPSPQQRWKLPVKEWVRELYFKRFKRHTLREETLKKVSSPEEDNLHSNGLTPRKAAAGPDPNQEIDIPF